MIAACTSRCGRLAMMGDFSLAADVIVARRTAVAYQARWQHGCSVPSDVAARHTAVAHHPRYGHSSTRSMCVVRAARRCCWADWQTYTAKRWSGATHRRLELYCSTMLPTMLTMSTRAVVQYDAAYHAYNEH